MITNRPFQNRIKNDPSVQWPWLVLIVLIALVFPSPLAQAQSFDSQKVKKSVVYIAARVSSSRAKTGTGFVLNDEGYIATNAHVVEGATSFMVAFAKPKKILKAKLVALYLAHDLAILKVSSVTDRAVVLSAHKFPEGKRVHAVGYPSISNAMADKNVFKSVFKGEQEANPTFSFGPLMQYIKTTKWGTGSGKGDANVRTVQHGALINKGNSGGPLFDNCGRVIGVNTKLLTNRRYATHLNYASEIAELIVFLKKKNIKFTISAMPCIAAAGGDAIIKAQKFVNEVMNDIILLMVVLIGIVIVVGVVLVVVLKGPRRKVKEFVERHSQLVLSKKDEPAPDLVSGSGSGDWKLAGRTSKGKKVEFKFNSDQLEKSGKGLVIGRNADLNDFVINDPSVSRRHARLMLLGAELEIEDLNSTNKTKLDGVSLKPFKSYKISAGEKIVLGKVKLTLSGG